MCWKICWKANLAKNTAFSGFEINCLSSGCSHFCIIPVTHTRWVSNEGYFDKDLEKRNKLIVKKCIMKNMKEIGLVMEISKQYLLTNYKLYSIQRFDCLQFDTNPASVAQTI